MGFLPGDISDKYNPFMGGLMDNLESICKHSSLKPALNQLKSQVEIVPIAFLRGRSFENTLLIVDEAQNLNLVALKTILTRVGAYSKVILLGSMNQIDDPRQARKEKCDFQKVIEKLSDRDYVGSVELVQSMRSPICVELDELLSEITD
jgi:predicted ribonuclease YlaK